MLQLIQALLSLFLPRNVVYIEQQSLSIGKRSNDEFNALKGEVLEKKITRAHYEVPEKENE